MKPEKAVSEINGSVAAATNNHIDSILDSSSANALTSLVVASAIYVCDRHASLKPLIKYNHYHSNTSDALG